jgi:Flp pilus assembly protein CpaB
VSRRARAVGFALLAILCAAASAMIAAGYRDSVDAQLGELREVVVVDAALPAGEPLGRKDVRRSLGVREVPIRFLPPDAIVDPAEAIGRKPVAAIPAGSYLLASQFRPPGGPTRSAGPTLGHGLQPVQISVTGAGALAALGTRARARVDVVVAGEPITGGRARVRVAAEGVRLLALEPASAADATSAGGDAWSATLALSRHQALDLIEAENFAREIRLIPEG